MAEGADILIQVQAQVDEAIQSLEQVKDTITTTSNEVDNKMTPSVTKNSNAVTNAGNKITAAGKKIKGALSTEAALAFTFAGQKATSFAKDCIDSAIKSESAWNRFGAMVDAGGGNWSQQSQKVKDWARDYSNSTGYAVADTRNASLALMQSGVSYDNLGESMKGVTALAARAGMTQEEASKTIIAALNNRGMALEKLTGLEMDNYKNADGTIDQQRLLADLYNQNSEAIKKHADSTEGAIAKLQNAWGGFKTSIGTALLPVINAVLPILTMIGEKFRTLPGPIKTVIAVFLVIGGIIGLVIGVLGLLAPALISIGGIIATIGTAGGIMAALGPVMTGLSVIFGGIAGAIGTVIGVLSTLAVPILVVIAAFLALYALGAYLGWWSDLGGMISAVGSALSWLGGQLMEFGKWLVLLFTDFPAAMSQLQSWVDNIKPMVANAINGLGSIIWNALSEVPGIVAEALGNLGNSVVDGGGLIAGITALFAPIPTLIFGLLMKAAPSVSSAVDWIKDSLINGFNNLISRLGDIGSGIRSIITGIFDFDLGSIFDGLVDVFGPELGVRLFTALNVALDYISNVGSLFSKIGDTIKTGLINSLSNLGNLVDGGGLLSGIRAILMPIPTLISGIFSRIAPLVIPKIRSVWTTVVNTFSQIGTRIIASIRTIPQRVAQQFMRLVTQIRLRLNQARAIAGTLINALRNAIITRVTSIPARIGAIFSLFVQMIRTRLTRAWAQATMLAGQIQQAVVDKIMQMYTDAQSWFNNLASNIISWLSTAAANAISGAQQIYNNIVNKIKEIPKAVGDELSKIPGKITSALASAASAAMSGAANIVSSFLAGMGINSPGKIQRWTIWEFNTVPDTIRSVAPIAATNAKNAAKGIVNSWFGELPDTLNTPEFNIGNTVGDMVNSIPATSKIDIVPNLIDLSRAFKYPVEPPAINSLSDVQLVSKDLKQPPVTEANNNVRYNTVNNEEHKKVVNIDRVQVDWNCNNLSTSQSRKLFYDAIHSL